MTEMDAAEEFDLCSLDELKTRMALSFEFRHPRLGRHEIAVFWDGEKAGAMDNYCPHQGAMLSYGLVEHGEVVCPLHAAVFDIVTGECLDRYTDDAQAYPVEIREGRVWVRAPGERLLPREA